MGVRGDCLTPILCQAVPPVVPLVEILNYSDYFYLNLNVFLFVIILCEGLLCQAFDLQKFSRPQKGLQPLRSDINLTSIDVSDEALDINKC